VEEYEEEKKRIVAMMNMICNIFTNKILASAAFDPRPPTHKLDIVTQQLNCILLLNYKHLQKEIPADFYVQGHLKNIVYSRSTHPWDKI
jgi:hypothetical protein